MPRSSRPELREFYGDLALADLYAGVAGRYVECGIVRLAPLDVLAHFDHLMLRIDRVMEGADAELLAAARPYHAFAALQRRLYQQFLDEAGTAEAGPADAPAARGCRDPHTFAHRTRVPAEAVTDRYCGPATVRYEDHRLPVHAELVKTLMDGEEDWSGVIEPPADGPDLLEVFHAESTTVHISEASGGFRGIEYRVDRRSMPITGEGPAPF
ncbi:hypothetical protein [Kitasatospora sp. KL5]|uniref:hypothetical protein n=1 Tax=Kitasatospora sp. KL5 TaxID=3425125 RepID=UPI003D6F3309